MKGNTLLARSVFGIFLFVFIFAGCSERDTDAYEIGVITPLTGQLSFLGEFTQQGMEIAKDEINEAGEINGRRIKLIYEDTRSTPRDAITAFNKLVSVNRVPVVIGDITSSATLAVAPVAEESRVVLFANGASDPQVRYAGDYIFRNWNSDEYEAMQMAEFAINELGYKRMAVLYAQEDYSLGLRNAFEEHFTKLGGEIAASIDYSPDMRDFRTIILRFPRDIDAIYLSGWPQDLGYFVRQAAQLNRQKPYLSSIGVQSDEFLEIAGEAANGVIYTAPSFDAEQPEGIEKEFVEKFQERYGKLPDVVSAVSYDALKIVAKAIEQGGYDSDGIRRALLEIENFPGVSGITTFDKYGDVSKPVAIRKIEGGRFVYFDN